ncbi:MAG TPA: histidine kinase [Bacteroidia bacterium]|nr:histidine kinase [Bacteroidia bacterium]
MQTSPFRELFRKYKFQLIAGAIGFWLFLGLIIYGSELAVHNFLGTKFIDDFEQRQYLLRWTLWLLLTPLLIVVALRINIRNTKIAWFVLVHFLLGNLFLAFEFTVEVSILMPIADRFYNRDVQLGEFAKPFVYKYFGYILNYFLILGITNIYVYMTSLQQTQKDLLEKEVANSELKYQLAIAQMQTLKMQIHPHFLFNTHNSILALIVKNENEKAAIMLGKLSNLLRSTIESQTEDYVTLKKELEITDLYLDLLATRFSERFRYVKEVDENTLHVKIPFFILQPLVENAVIHGVEKTDGTSILKLKCEKDNGQLFISVSNTTPGNIRADEIKYGIGLTNVINRLEKYYGNKSSLKLDLTGTEAVLTINLPLDEKRG